MLRRARATTFTSPWFGPVLAGSASWNVARHVSIDLRIETGFALLSASANAVHTSIDGRVTSSQSVADIGGVWIGAQLGIAGQQAEVRVDPGSDRVIVPGGQVQPADPGRYAMKWDGEWHITYEVFRDLGIAFAAVLILIYGLVVGWFQSFVTPLVIMAAIPFSLVGILPAHSLLHASFTATTMNGFTAPGKMIILGAGRGLLVVSHDLQLPAALGGRVIALHDGRVARQPGGPRDQCNHGRSAPRLCGRGRKWHNYNGAPGRGLIECVMGKDYDRSAATLF